jgi:hypothetical protein
MASGETSEGEFERMLAEWQKCYSNKRKREYYFNASTGESLWTIEEVSAQIDAFLKHKNEKSRKDSKRHGLKKTAASSGVKASTSSHDVQMSIADEFITESEEHIPMEIDEIVENVAIYQN